MGTGTHSLSGYSGRDDLVLRGGGAVLRPVRRLRVDAARAARPARRPAWMLLYMLLPLCAALLVLADRVPAGGGLRALAEGGVVALVIGLAAVWVRANRRALSRMPLEPETDTEPTDLRLEVNEPSPLVIHLARTIHDRARESSGSNGM